MEAENREAVPGGNSLVTVLPPMYLVCELSGEPCSAGCDETR